eukprot:jgi/Bigna1/72961/fgenesh1_pg.22_\
MPKSLNEQQARKNKSSFWLVYEGSVDYRLSPSVQINVAFGILNLNMGLLQSSHERLFRRLLSTSLVHQSSRVLPRIKKALSRGANVNCAVGHEKFTPLMLAVRAGNLSAVKLLVEHGNADLRKRDKNEMTALLWAARMGRAEIMKYLINQGADPNVIDRSEMTPIMIAAKHNHPDVGLRFPETVINYAIKAQMDTNLLRDICQRISSEFQAQTANNMLHQALRSAVLSGYLEATVMLVEEFHIWFLETASDGKCAFTLAYQARQHEISLYFVQRVANVVEGSSRERRLFSLTQSDRPSPALSFPRRSTNAASIRLTPRGFSRNYRNWLREAVSVASNMLESTEICDSVAVAA